MHACVCQETGWLQKIYHCLIRLRVSYYCYHSPPSSARRPRCYISLYMTRSPHTHTHTQACVSTHTAEQYISVSVTGSVCVSPIIWPLDSNGWERRGEFSCGLNTRAFITHNRSTSHSVEIGRRRTRSREEKLAPIKNEKDQRDCILLAS